MGSEPKEIELSNRLDAAGYTVFKSPSSGAATNRDQVDLVAWGLDDAGKFQAFAIEHKSISADLIYLSEEQIEQLRSVAVGPFEPIISTYFKYDAGRVSPSAHPPYGNDEDDGYRFIHLDDLESDPDRAPESRYRIKRDENWERGLTMRELLTGGKQLIADGGDLDDQQLCPECGSNDARVVVALPGTQGVVLACPWCADKMEINHE